MNSASVIVIDVSLYPNEVKLPFVISVSSQPSTIISDGHVKLGAVVSSIVIVCSHVVVLSHGSVTVYVLVIIIGQVPLIASTYSIL